MTTGATAVLGVGVHGAHLSRTKGMSEVAETGALHHYREISVAMGVSVALWQVAVGTHDLRGSPVPGVWPSIQYPLGP